MLDHWVDKFYRKMQELKREKIELRMGFGISGALPHPWVPNTIPIHKTPHKQFTKPTRTNPKIHTVDQ